MKSHLVVIGAELYLEEARAKFLAVPDDRKRFFHSHTEAYTRGKLDEFAIVFDFSSIESPSMLGYFADFPLIALFVNAPFLELNELFALHKWKFPCPVYGFNGLPGLFNRSVLEVSALKDTPKQALEALSSDFMLDYRLIGDRVGMVTPRIIAMVINEAFYTLQEGTASADDIDMSMRLGTNYPYGPFEWCDKIGIEHIFNLLERLYATTHDERYKACPLLRTRYFEKIGN